MPRSANVCPRNRVRYTTTFREVEQLVDATYTSDRRPLIAAANLGIEKLRFPHRLANNLRYPDLCTPFERRRRLRTGNLT